MPYIDKKSREEIGLVGSTRLPETAGELTYVLYRDIKEFLGNNARFADYAAALGALEACKLEIYRRSVAPYEDQKIKENGDV